MKATFPDIMKLGAQALSECYHVLDDDPPKEPAVTVESGQTHIKDLKVGKTGAICEISLEITGANTVDFGIYRREEYEAYKAGRRDVLVPVAACKNTVELEAAQVILDAGAYLLTVHNPHPSPILIKLNHKLRKP